MKKIKVCLLIIMTSVILSGGSMAQVKPMKVKNQKSLLESENPYLAQNKKLVYDFWRVVFEGGHPDKADKYMKEDYIQHNPLVATGREAFVNFFSQFTEPKPIVDTIQADLFAIVAEDDYVTLCFNRHYKDPADTSQFYHTTWFDMFRIEDGMIAEHWDAATKR